MQNPIAFRGNNLGRLTKDTINLSSSSSKAVLTTLGSGIAAITAAASQLAKNPQREKEMLIKSIVDENNNPLFKDDDYDYKDISSSLDNINIENLPVPQKIYSNTTNTYRYIITDLLNKIDTPDKAEFVTKEKVILKDFLKNIKENGQINPKFDINKFEQKVNYVAGKDITAPEVSTNNKINLFRNFLSNSSEIENIIKNIDFTIYGKQGLPLKFSRKEYVSGLNNILEGVSDEEKSIILDKLNIKPSKRGNGYDGLVEINSLDKDNPIEAKIYNLSKDFLYNNEVKTGNKDYDEKLIFESMNEPRLINTDYEWWINNSSDECKDAISCINVLNQTFVDTVRASGGNNETRYLMCPGYDASADGALHSGYVLPTDKEGVTDRIMVSIHAYTPYDFALNISGTAYFDAATKSCTNDIDVFMDKLYKKFIENGVPVVIGEFGALAKRDRNNGDNVQARVDYAAYYIAAARARGMSCLWWDNNAFSGNGENFGLYYRTGGYFIYQDIVDALMKYADAELE